MTERLIILFLLSLIVTNYEADSVIVTEVRAGNLAELPCPSNDDRHRFMFWQLADENIIIGPGNPIDQEKYNYEVLTGKLLIRQVSTSESGFYKCVSRGLKNAAAINIQLVELIVSKDQIIESNFETHLLRTLTIVMLILVAIAGVLLIIVYKKKKTNRFFEMDESRENSPGKYNEKFPSRTTASTASAAATTTRTTLATPTTTTSSGKIGVDNVGLDVDFPKSFINMEKDEPLF